MTQAIISCLEINSWIAKLFVSNGILLVAILQLTFFVFGTLVYSRLVANWRNLAISPNPSVMRGFWDSLEVSTDFNYGSSRAYFTTLSASSTFTVSYKCILNVRPLGFADKIVSKENS